MRSCWIGGSVAACVLAAVIPIDRAAADSSAARKRPAKAAPAKAPKPRAAARAKPPPKHAKAAKAVPPAAARASALDEELARLADDPLLAGADRVEGKEAKGLVAFTFDDGPNAETTPAVLDALQKYDVPATFFIVTRRISGRLGAKNREVLAQVLQRGYLVASHTVSHLNLRHASTKTIGHEIDKSLRTLAKQTGRAIGLFRPPYGAIDQRGRAHLRKRGLTEVRWSIDTVDWKLRDVEELRTRTLATILKQEGGVVLMHDVKEVTARSIALVLDDLEAANCQRLTDKRPPILPVSLHYFLRDKGKPRAIPDDVKKRTDAYRNGLPARCAARSKPDPNGDAPAETPRLAQATATAEAPAAGSAPATGGAATPAAAPATGGAATPAAAPAARGAATPAAAPSAGGAATPAR